jgi:hypothetical protein
LCIILAVVFVVTFFFFFGFGFGGDLATIFMGWTGPSYWVGEAGAADLVAGLYTTTLWSGECGDGGRRGV